MTDMPDNSAYDVVIIGAGISGINIAYHLQRNFPKLKYRVLEGRSNIGGTWDLFRYPGIRSDTDLHTFGFGWNLWNENRAIADGPSIANYLKKSAEKEGIYGRILFNHVVKAANWSSDLQSWNLRVETVSETIGIQTRFLILGTGYYDYEKPLNPEIPGLSTEFKNTVAHPQFWPEDLDYENKRVVIIGSGATAITLLPNIAKKAAHVTMLQRSPTYIMSINNATGNSWYHKLLPRSWSFRVDRIIFMWTAIFLYNMCRLFPESSRRKLQTAMEKELPEHVPVDPNFTPRYKPWDQRVCFAPDGDFFQSFRAGKAHVETGSIQAVNASSITLESGKKLEADIIVPATGLRLIIAGGIEITVDDKPIDLTDRYAWRAALLQDVPNLAFLMGYINASWTLGAETTAHLVCRLLRHMERKNFGVAIPRLPVNLQMQPRPIWNLDATYVKKSESSMPRCGDTGPWKGRTNYFLDLLKAKYGSIDQGMEFQKARKTKNL